MKVEFDTQYFKLVKGDFKAAMMLSFAIKFQEVKKDNERWKMSVYEWEKLGFGNKGSQWAIRKKLKTIPAWNEYRVGWPAHNEFWIDLELLEKQMNQINKGEKNE